MKEFFKKDLTLKILSIVFAMFIWFAVNPVKTSYYTVPLTVINEESLRSKGLVLNTKAYQKYVVISVRDRGDVLDAIKDTDFVATLDLSKVKTVEDKVVDLEAPEYLGRENINANNIDLKPKSIKLDLGKIEENPFIVQIETSGKLPTGYEIISKTAEPDTVSIQALDTVINSVGSVKVEVDVSGLNRTLEIQKECKVFNKKGEEMPELAKKLTVNIKIEVGKRVPVIPITKGILAKDFIEGVHTVKPEKILITGDLDLMDGVNEVKTEPVDIENATKTFSAQVLLQLPEGIRLVSSTREVGVTVEIIPLLVRNMELLAENITIEGKKIDGTVDYEITPPVTIKLKGKVEDLNIVTISSLLASINVDGLADGTHNVPLKVNLPSNITQVEEVLVPVKITTR
ncbi:MAG TPA: CdaR family protein [Ruminiclostridium sp.]